MPRRPTHVSLSLTMVALAAAFPAFTLAGENDRADASAAEASREVRRTGTVSPESYLSHVRFLAGDELMGRDVGTPGIEAAARYVAEQFRVAGLKPGGSDGTYFQAFDLNFWRRLGDRNRVTWIAGDKKVVLEHDLDFTTMPWARPDRFVGAITYVGYGIVAEADERRGVSTPAYDDYADVDVAGKTVLMFRHDPTFLRPDPNDPDTHSTHAAFRRKAQRARDRGAAAILIVNTASMANEDELTEFTREGQGNLGLPMIHLSRRAANRLLKAGGLADLDLLEREIESTQRPHSRELTDVAIDGEADIRSDGPIVKNVIGVLPGTGPDRDEHIVIGGHFDHLGKSISQWTRSGPQRVHNGADDNASGTAAVIECAKLFGGGKRPNRSIVFMAFTAEEKGLLGSRHWVDHPTIPLDRIVAMFNMDMVGRLREESVQVGGMRTGDGLESMVKTAAKEYGLKVIDGGGGIGPSDHASFYSKGIPVLFMFTGLHGQYHRPEDDVELINAQGAARIAQLVADVAYQVAGLPEAPAYSADASPEILWNPDGSAPARSTTRTRGVRLGIVPSDGDGPGLGIERVLEGSPAATAELRAGDRILRIGDTTISDIQDLRRALSGVRDGDRLAFEIRRGDATIEIQVGFGDQPESAARADTDKPAAANPDRPPRANPHAGMGETSQTPAMPRVRMGIMPSYTPRENQRGFAIEGVTDDGAAKKAGMRNGDVILSIGGKKVWDIYSYMESLQGFMPGDEIRVVVLRDDKEVELTVKGEAGRQEQN